MRDASNQLVRQLLVVNSLVIEEALIGDENGTLPLCVYIEGFGKTGHI